MNDEKKIYNEIMSFLDDVEEEKTNYSEEEKKIFDNIIEQDYDITLYKEKRLKKIIAYIILCNKENNIKDNIKRNIIHYLITRNNFYDIIQLSDNLLKIVKEYLQGKTIFKENSQICTNDLFCYSQNFADHFNEFCKDGVIDEKIKEFIILLIPEYYFNSEHSKNNKETCQKELLSYITNNGLQISLFRENTEDLQRQYNNLDNNKKKILHLLEESKENVKKITREIKKLTEEISELEKKEKEGLSVEEEECKIKKINLKEKKERKKEKIQSEYLINRKKITIFLNTKKQQNLIIERIKKISTFKLDLLKLIISDNNLYKDNTDNEERLLCDIINKKGYDIILSEIQLKIRECIQEEKKKIINSFNNFPPTDEKLLDSLPLEKIKEKLNIQDNNEIKKFAKLFNGITINIGEADFQLKFSEKEIDENPDLFLQVFSLQVAKKCIDDNEKKFFPNIEVEEIPAEKAEYFIHNEDFNLKIKKEDTKKLEEEEAEEEETEEKEKKEDEAVIEEEEKNEEEEKEEEEKEEENLKENEQKKKEIGEVEIKLSKSLENDYLFNKKHDINRRRELTLDKGPDSAERIRKNYELHKDNKIMPKGLLLNILDSIYKEINILKSPKKNNIQKKNEKFNDNYLDSLSKTYSEEFIKKEPIKQNNNNQLQEPQLEVIEDNLIITTSNDKYTINKKLFNGLSQKYSTKIQGKEKYLSFDEYVASINPQNNVSIPEFLQKSPEQAITEFNNNHTNFEKLANNLKKYKDFRAIGDLLGNFDLHNYKNSTNDGKKTQILEIKKKVIDNLKSHEISNKDLDISINSLENLDTSLNDEELILNNEQIERKKQTYSKIQFLRSIEETLYNNDVIIPNKPFIQNAKDLLSKFTIYYKAFSLGIDPMENKLYQTDNHGNRQSINYNQDNEDFYKLKETILKNILDTLQSNINEVESDLLKISDKNLQKSLRDNLFSATECFEKVKQNIKNGKVNSLKDKNFEGDVINCLESLKNLKSNIISTSQNNNAGKIRKNIKKTITDEIAIMQARIQKRTNDIEDIKVDIDDKKKENRKEQLLKQSKKIDAIQKNLLETLEEYDDNKIEEFETNTENFLQNLLQQTKEDDVKNQQTIDQIYYSERIKSLGQMSKKVNNVILNLKQKQVEEKNTQDLKEQKKLEENEEKRAEKYSEDISTNQHFGFLTSLKNKIIFGTGTGMSFVLLILTVVVFPSIGISAIVGGASGSFVSFLLTVGFCKKNQIDQNKEITLQNYKNRTNVKLDLIKNSSGLKSEIKSKRKTNDEKKEQKNNQQPIYNQTQTRQFGGTQTTPF